ncbi:transcription factor tfiiib component b'' [Anaeramoeba flamelloides]|uniref:Transcription factor tfiiib component b n=1 Tax=Anaeramoeba flamelloides TaxID=1746091 RepID=A0AAV7YTB9_9EUKA|nr:transcription factor tfiiib component b'' [Anaeramoeba flamelloides]
MSTTTSTTTLSSSSTETIMTSSSSESFSQESNKEKEKNKKKKRNKSKYKKIIPTPQKLFWIPDSFSEDQSILEYLKTNSIRLKAIKIKGKNKTKTTNKFSKKSENILLTDLHQLENRQFLKFLQSNKSFLARLIILSTKEQDANRIKKRIKNSGVIKYASINIATKKEGVLTIINTLRKQPKGKMEKKIHKPRRKSNQQADEQKKQTKIEEKEKDDQKNNQTNEKKSTSFPMQVEEKKEYDQKKQPDEQEKKNKKGEEGFLQEKQTNISEPKKEKQEKKNEEEIIKNRISQPLNFQFNKLIVYSEEVFNPNIFKLKSLLSKKANCELEFEISYKWSNYKELIFYNLEKNNRIVCLLEFKTSMDSKGHKKMIRSLKDQIQNESIIIVHGNKKPNKLDSSSKTTMNRYFKNGVDFIIEEYEEIVHTILNKEILKEKLKKRKQAPNSSSNTSQLKEQLKNKENVKKKQTLTQLEGLIFFLIGESFECSSVVFSLKNKSNLMIQKFYQQMIFFQQIFELQHILNCIVVDSLYFNKIQFRSQLLEIPQKVKIVCFLKPDKRNTENVNNFQKEYGNYFDYLIDDLIYLKQLIINISLLGENNINNNENFDDNFYYKGKRKFTIKTKDEISQNKYGNRENNNDGRNYKNNNNGESGGDGDGDFYMNTDHIDPNQLYIQKQIEEQQSMDFIKKTQEKEREDQTKNLRLIRNLYNNETMVQQEQEQERYRLLQLHYENQNNIFPNYSNQLQEKEIRIITSKILNTFPQNIKINFLKYLKATGRKENENYRICGQVKYGNVFKGNGNKKRLFTFIKSKCNLMNPQYYDLCNNMGCDICYLMRGTMDCSGGVVFSDNPYILFAEYVNQSHNRKYILVECDVMCGIERTGKKFYVQSIPDYGCLKIKRGYAKYFIKDVRAITPLYITIFQL